MTLGSERSERLFIRILKQHLYVVQRGLDTPPSNADVLWLCI